MKKAKIVIALFIALLLMFSAAGCSGAVYENYVSEIRDNVFLGETEHFEVCVYSGKRESPYKADGLANSMIPYFLVIVEPKFDTTEDDVLSMSVVIKDKVYVKSVTQDVFTQKFVADYTDLTASGNFTVNLQILNYDEDAALIEMFTAGMKTYREALKEGMEMLKDKFNASKDGNTYNCEIYVRLSVERFLAERKLFWYVSILDSLGNFNGVIIEVEK